MKRIVFLFLIFSLTSCTDSFLTLAPPNLLTEASFFKTEADAQSALIAAYGQLQSDAAFSNSFEAQYTDWAMTGDLYPMDGSATQLATYSLSLPPNLGFHNNLYPAAWLGISRANFVIDRTEQMDGLDSEVKALIVAQAKFLRGMFYYRLANYWGGVPLILNELNASSELNVPRASAEETWAQVYKDFADAASRLPLSWDNSNTGRATKLAALAYLAKTCLWQRKWDEVVTYSEQIINAGQNELLPSYRSVFLESNEYNKEILFATRYIEVTAAEGEGNLNTVRSAPRGAPVEFTGPLAFSNHIPEPQYIDAFEKDETGKIIDKRYWESIIGPGEAHQDMPAFVMPVNVPVSMSRSGYIVTKYWHKAPSVDRGGVDAPIIRYAEVLLNYAEALNETGRSDEAIDQINLIRSRAGLKSLSKSHSKDEILDAIFYERRMEFMWEPSGAFSDLNRRGRFMDFVRKNRRDFENLNVGNKPWLSANPILFPIPQDALNRNNALVQNPHYN